MLVEIRCDSFAVENRTIQFLDGLNVILGSKNGSNAIGKSTFLWMIDYAFGGLGYHALWKDIAHHIGKQPVYFAFSFQGQLHYFYRTLQEPRIVCRCDSTGHIIQKITLDAYQHFLYENYGIDRVGTDFSDLREHFFRIYGGENTYERTPYLVKPREKDGKAIEFLLRLFGNGLLLKEIQDMEDEHGIHGQTSVKEQPVNMEKIEQNEKSISSLKDRLKKLMTNADDVQMAAWGFDTQTNQRLEELRNDLRQLTRERNRLQSQRNAIEEKQPFLAENMEGEFQELLSFFPQTELRPFAQIESFHKQVRSILSAEAAEEITRLELLIRQCDAEISVIRSKLEEKGFARELSERTISQCVNIKMSIARMEEENDALFRQKEQQEARQRVQALMNHLLQQRQEGLDSLVSDINRCMERFNRTVTLGQESQPRLRISDEEELSFGTLGNTSEGTAFKSMVLYDLAIMVLTPVPVLIHDSNILKRIGDTHLEQILQQYIALGKQVFIAFDKADSATQGAQHCLTDHAVLTLDDDHVLFGKSWK